MRGLRSLSSSAVCAHASFMQRFRAPFCQIASFPFKSICFVHLWPRLLVRAGHSILCSRGVKVEHLFHDFFVMVVFWFFQGCRDYQGLSLWNYSILPEKKKMDCGWSCFVPVGTAVVLSWADTVGEEAITVALALTKTLHLQGEEEITPQWCLTLLPHLGSWALGPVNGYTTTATMAVIQSHKQRATNQQL